MSGNDIPAFPRTGEGFGNPAYDTAGMSLRDYYIGQALSAIGPLVLRCWDDGQDAAESKQALVDMCEGFADEILDRRMKGGTK
jgi:hypothetical protein